MTSVVLTRENIDEIAEKTHMPKDVLWEMYQGANRGNNVIIFHLEDDGG